MSGFPTIPVICMTWKSHCVADAQAVLFDAHCSAPKLSALAYKVGTSHEAPDEYDQQTHSFMLALAEKFIARDCTSQFLQDMNRL